MTEKTRLLVLRPGSRGCVLAALKGWTLVEETEDCVRWQRDISTAVFTVTPHSGFEALVLTGAQPGEIPGSLPILSAQSIQSMISSPDVRTALAGLQAAEASGWPVLALPVCGRLADDDPLVARTAGAALLAIGTAALEDPKVDAGAALFSLAGWRREKLQVLRRFRPDCGLQSEAMAKGVAAALHDEDWEIRVTAILAADRLKLVGLEKSIASLPLPTGRREGVDDHDMRVLMAVRDGVVARLGGVENPQVPASIHRLLDGTENAAPSPAMMLIHALSQPVETRLLPGPERAYIQAGDGTKTSVDGAPVVWVPPGEYILGDAVARRELRRCALEAGFLIDAAWRGASSYDDAIAEAASAACRLGCRVALPTSDQLEMAARGTDGRRFAWGLNADRQVWSDLSPMGLTDLVGRTGEWIAGGGAVSGGGKRPACATRLAPSPARPQGYRFVFVDHAQ